MKLTSAQLDRAAGLLLGMACGDALGAGYEFGPRWPTRTRLSPRPCGHAIWTDRSVECAQHFDNGHPAAVLVSPERNEVLMIALEDSEDIAVFDSAMEDEGANITWEQVKADTPRIAAHPVALAVKLADIADNRLPSRTSKLDAETRDRLADKYAKALKALGA